MRGLANTPVRARQPLSHHRNLNVSKEFSIRCLRFKIRLSVDCIASALALNDESAPLLSHQSSLAGNDADSKSLQAQTSITHSSDSNLPFGRQLSSPSLSNLALEASFYSCVPLLCGLLCVVVDLEGGLRATSEVRLFEVAICREYYNLHDPSKIDSPPLSYVHERDCKLDNIQTDLAYLRACKEISMMVPGEDPLASEI